ncbi:uncharacterized protein IL334_006332 [Kwoniella shivajii]|uniref:Uncharacterized protein n=1 Tax=Kwoniella shivajii TaxID=564305 RepID=A0ABZ1D5Z9_9TREE|nr:hypothetical protein IL334_006332 [Kwoniella shivajii]
MSQEYWEDDPMDMDEWEEAILNSENIHTPAPPSTQPPPPPPPPPARLTCTIKAEDDERHRQDPSVPAKRMYDFRCDDPELWILGKQYQSISSIRMYRRMTWTGPSHLRPLIIYERDNESKRQDHQVQAGPSNRPQSPISVSSTPPDSPIPLSSSSNPSWIHDNVDIRQSPSNLPLPTIFSDRPNPPISAKGQPLPEAAYDPHCIGWYNGGLVRQRMDQNWSSASVVGMWGLTVAEEMISSQALKTREREGIVDELKTLREEVDSILKAETKRSKQ